MKKIEKDFRCFSGDISKIDFVLPVVVDMIENSYYKNCVYKYFFPLFHTDFCINKFYQAYENNIPTVIPYVYESPVILTYRFISVATRIKLEWLFSGNLHQVEINKLSATVNKLFIAPLSFEYAGRIREKYTIIPNATASDSVKREKR